MPRLFSVDGIEVVIKPVPNGYRIIAHDASQRIPFTLSLTQARLLASTLLQKPKKKKA